MIKEDKENAFEMLFLHSKPVKMLVALKQDDIINATHVSKSVNCTYSHTVKVLEMFKDYGLVKFDKKGRIKVVKLTDIGTDIAHDFEGIRRKFVKIKVPEKEASEKSKK
ncbi:MAG: hypothetical protein PHU12_02595 [Candidatus Aenigmarchaeota archaeon]|nr:hypothetical protein [Candidatus Aenigmarchaeota archaeon]